MGLFSKSKGGMRTQNQASNELLSKYSSIAFVALSLTYLVFLILEATLSTHAFNSEWRQKVTTLVIFGCIALAFTTTKTQQCSNALDNLFSHASRYKFFLIEVITGVYVLVFIIFELQSVPFSDLPKIPEITKGLNFALFVVSIIRVAQNWIFKSILIAAPALYLGLTTVIKTPDHYTGAASIPIVLLIAVLNYLEGRYLKVQQQQNHKEIEFWKSSLDKTNDGVLMLEEQYQAFFINEACKKILSRHGNEAIAAIEEFQFESLSPFEEIEVIESTNFQDIPNMNEENTYTLVEFLKALSERVRKTGRLSEETNENVNDLIMTLETRAKSLTSDLLYYQIKISGLNFDGKFFFMLTIMDITAAKSTFQWKQRFESSSKVLASVTHELRTPLNGSINFLQLALDNERVPGDIKAKILLPARRSNLLLLNLVNDILDFSRLREGKIKLNIEKRNLMDTLREAVELLELQAKRKGIQLNFIPKDIETELDFATDHQRVKQIILNLLSNSVKFTQQGSVTLSLENYTTETQRAEGRVLKLRVADTGIGISDEDQKHLFQEYSQVGGENQRRAFNPNGLGLGLSIANTLAKLLGPVRNANSTSPAIKVTSKINVGSEFHFIIEEKKLLLLELNNSQQSQQSETILASPCRSADTSFTSSSVRHTEECPMLNQSTNIRPSQFLRRYCNPEKLPRELLHQPEFRNPHHKVSVGSEGPIARVNRYRFTMGPQLPFQREKEQRSSIFQEVEAGCKCARILVVDDDSFNLIASEMVFSGFKLAIDTAFNGKEAIEKVLSKNNKSKQNSECNECGGQYSVVFMDISMPVMDGNSAAKELKKMMSEDMIHQVSLVACSAISQGENVLAHFDDECLKPFTKSRIRELLERFGFYFKRQAIISHRKFSMDDYCPSS